MPKIPRMRFGSLHNVFDKGLPLLRGEDFEDIIDSLMDSIV